MNGIHQSSRKFHLLFGGIGTMNPAPWQPLRRALTVRWVR
jgi:hypothetical protein